jgi:hypothetical protein
MADIWEAVKEVGGLAAVGGVIDFLLSKAQQAKLKAWLENWWLRFSYVNWRNFGRREAEAAVAMLDRWAGPRLWSWKRWRFSILVCLLVRAFMAMTMIALIPLQDLIAMYGAEPDRPTDSLLKCLLDEALVVPSVMIAFALSLSLTRAVAVLIGKMCRGTIVDAVMFLFLLVIHWLIFAYWSAVGSLLTNLPWDAGGATDVAARLVMPDRSDSGVENLRSHNLCETSQARSHMQQLVLHPLIVRSHDAHAVSYRGLADMHHQEACGLGSPHRALDCCSSNGCGRGFPKCRHLVAKLRGRHISSSPTCGLLISPL